MLINLLKKIDTNPFASMEQLGVEMNISTQMVENLVADLTKRGYLISYENCVDACDHCMLSDACTGKSHPRIWSISEKGRELVRR